MPFNSGTSAFKDAATREVIDGAMELDMIIINIGRDPTKVANGLRIGAYYLAELEQVVERGYTRVIDWKW